MLSAHVKKAYLAISYYYDNFRKGKADDESGMFSDLYGQTTEAGATIYFVLLRVGVYASGLAILVCAVSLIRNSKAGSPKLAEAKANAVKVLIVSALIFAVTGAVCFLQKLGL